MNGSFNTVVVRPLDRKESIIKIFNIKLKQYRLTNI
jgi:hypothetical protein